MASTKLSWFATEKGQKFVFTGIACIGGGLMCLHIVPKTFLLDKYKGFVQQYKMGVEVPVPPNMCKMIDEVIDDMNIPLPERKLIKPFMIFGFDVFHTGTTTSKYGAIVGIPSSFTFETTDADDFKRLLVKNEPVDWSSKHASDLKEALVLSSDARKFAIGREIASSQTIQPYLNGFYPVATMMGIYTLTYNFNRRLKLFARPLAMRCSLYAIMGLFGFGTWAFMNDFSNVYFEANADNQVCKLGDSYVRGGAEFYAKILKRNVALRNLMGKQGENLYSVLGNDVFFIRQKRMPIVHRKSFMEAKLNEIIARTNQPEVEVV